MNLLLISPDRINFKFTHDKIVNKINSNQNSIGSILNTIKDNSADIIIIPAEQEIDGNILGGIELLKHIRLTLDLGDISKKPIVLLHWLPIDYYIQKDKENLFLYSPGIYSYRLPAKEINLADLKGLEEYLNPFLFNSEKDQSISSHVFRNQIAIEQFKNQVNNPGEGFQGKDLWFKKLFYKNHSYIKLGELKKVEVIAEPLKILFADDMAAEWESALKTIMPNAELNAFNNKLTLIEELNSINEKKQAIISNFYSNTEYLRTTQESYSNFHETKKGIQKEIDSKEIVLKNSEKKLKDTQGEDLKLKTTFSTLIQQLSSSGGLLEVLISNTDVDNIDDTNRKDAQDLSEIIRKVLSNKTELKTQNNTIKKVKEEVSKLKVQYSEIEENIKQINEKRKETQTELDKTIDELFNPYYDLVLLDMHFTKSSESIDIKDTDGYLILKKINELNINLPVVVFSATTKDFQVALKGFPFIINRFIKGISPANEFKKIAETAYQNREITNLTELVNQLINFDKYFGRRYKQNDDADFSNYSIAEEKRKEIKSKLSSILTKFRLYQNEKKIQDLIEIIQLLGIIQENRLLLPSQGEKNSFWYIDNIQKNKIGNDEKFLRDGRNAVSHAGKEEWKNKINLEYIRSLLITTYKRLLLG